MDWPQVDGEVTIPVIRGQASSVYGEVDGEIMKHGAVQVGEYIAECGDDFIERVRCISELLKGKT